MKSLMYFVYSLLIVSLSISCTKDESVVPDEYVTIQTNNVTTSTYYTTNCLQSFDLGMHIYDYQDESIDIDIVTYSESIQSDFILDCVSDAEPITPGEAFVILRYSDTVYHSETGVLSIVDGVIVIEGMFYQLFDRTYTEYLFKINLVCEDI